MGVTLDDEGLESGINLHEVFHLLQVGTGSEERFAVFILESIGDEGTVGSVEIRICERVPEAPCGSVRHVIHLHRPCLVVEAAAEINHAQIEKREAVAEVAQVDKVFLSGGDEDAVTELQVSVDCSVGIRRSGYVVMDLLFLSGGEVRVGFEHRAEAVLDVFETRGVHVGVMQREAHLSELLSVEFGFLGVVAAGAGERLLIHEAAETDAYLLAIGYQVTGFGSRDTHLVHFACELELEFRCFGIAEVEFKHDIGVLTVVITGAVSAFTYSLIFGEIDSFWGHFFNGGLINGDAAKPLNGGLNQLDVTGLLVGHFCYLGILGVMAVKGVKKAFKTDLATSGLEDADNTDILQTDCGRDDVDVGVAELMARETIGVLFVGPDEPADVTEGVALERFKDT